MTTQGTMKVSREELTVLLPEEGIISHKDLIEFLSKHLKDEALEVKEERLFIRRRGIQFFAVLDFNEEKKGLSPLFVVKSEMGNKASIQFMSGYRHTKNANVFLSKDLVVLRKKKISNAQVKAAIPKCIQKLREQNVTLFGTIEAIKLAHLLDPMAKMRIYDAIFVDKILPDKCATSAHEFYFKKGSEDLKGAWRLYNALSFSTKKIKDLHRNLLVLRRLSLYMEEQFLTAKKEI